MGTEVAGEVAYHEMSMYALIKLAESIKLKIEHWVPFLGGYGIQQTLESRFIGSYKGAVETK